MTGWLDTLAGVITPATLALVLGAAFVAGFLRGFVGFGGALVVIMVLSAVYGPHLAVAAAALSGVISMFQLLPEAVRHSDRNFVIPFGAASFIAAPMGTLVLVAIAPELMRMAISGFVLLMVAMLYLDWRPSRRPGRMASFGAGIVAGLVQGSAGIGGPPAVAFALSRPGTAQQQRANVLGALVSLTLCALGPLWYQGLFSQLSIIIGLMLIPVYSAATWIGARYFSRGGHQHYRYAALFALAAIGVITLAMAVQEYVTG